MEPNFLKYVSEFPNEIPYPVTPSENTKRIVLDTSDDTRPPSIVSSYNVAAVLGLDPWTSADQEFEFKVGLRIKEQTAAMRHGQDMEKVAAQKFSTEHNKVLFTVPVVTCKENRYVCAFLDRITEQGENVEIKVPYSQVVVEDADLEYIQKSKASYYHQMQLQMHVLNLDKTWFVQYGAPPNKFHTKTEDTKVAHGNFQPREVLSVVLVPRDPLWWPTHQKKINEFVDRVLLYQQTQDQYHKRNRKDK